MKDNQQLIASYFSLAGDAVPFEEPEKEVSPHSLEARAEAASAAGFAGIGLSSVDIAALLKRMTLQDLRRTLDGAGLPLLELECVVDWHTSGERRTLSDGVRRLLLECSDSIGACHIKVAGDQFGETFDRAQMARNFRHLCDDAASAGTRIVVEPMPWSNIRDLHDAARLVSDSGADNGGSLLDIWHVARAGSDFGDIAKIPPETIGHIELCDALLSHGPDLKLDTINHRRLCGEGQLDVAGFVQQVKQAGYSGLWGVEVISFEQRRRSVGSAASLCFDSTIEFL